MCLCTIPTLAAARVAREETRRTGEPSYVTIVEHCPDHGRSARPTMWVGVAGQMDLTPLIWFGLDLMTDGEAR